jgi:hypothetical protein
VQIPFLLLLQAPPLLLTLPPDLVLLDCEVLSLALYRPSQATRLGGRQSREDRHQDSRDSQSHRIYYLTEWRGGA